MIYSLVADILVLVKRSSRYDKHFRSELSNYKITSKLLSLCNLTRQ